MGIETALIAVAAAGTAASVGSAIMANNTSRALAGSANALTADQFEKSLEYNHNEAALAREYNTRERLETQNFNIQMQNEQRQWLLDNFSPSAQSESLRKAGINPANTLSGNAASVGSAMTSPVSSSPATSSAPSAPGIPSQSLPEVKQIFENSQTLGAIDAVVGALDKREDITTKKINNESLRLRNLEEIKNLQASNRKIIEDTKLSKSQRMKAYQENKNLEIQAGILMAENRMKNIQADTTQNLIDKQLREYDDRHLESEIDRRSKQLSMRLARNADQRDQDRLTWAIRDTMSSIALRRKEGKSIDKDIIAKDLANRLGRNKADREDSALTHMRGTILGQAVDDIAYWLTSLGGNIFGSLGK